MAFGRIGPPMRITNNADVVTTSRCIVYGNEWSDDLEGTFFDILYEDPRFCDVLDGDLTLCTNSSALPGNNAWGVQMGAHGSACPDCDTPVEDVSWGSVEGAVQIGEATMRRLTVVIGIALLSTATLSHAETILVDWMGGGDYTTIQEGIDAADPGDTVLVAAGTYSGENNRNLDFDGKEITVMSSGGRQSVTINADGQSRAFTFWHGEGPGAVLSGFTIQNGSAAYGGGIFLIGSSPTITDCDIVACTATSVSSGGGGVLCKDGSSPTLTDVTISACQAEHGAGMMSHYGGAPSLTRVLFAGNTAISRGGGYYCETPDGTVNITDCAFYNNTVVSVGSGGGGVHFFEGSANITGTTFAYNRGNLGACIRLSSGSSATIESCILSFGRVGYPIDHGGGGAGPATSRCIVYGNEAGDDLVGMYIRHPQRGPALLRRAGRRHDALHELVGAAGEQRLGRAVGRIRLGLPGLRLAGGGRELGGGEGNLPVASPCLTSHDKPGILGVILTHN